MIRDTLIHLGYIAASILFILGLKMLSRQQTARRGNAISAVGMLLAILCTLVSRGLSYEWIILGIVIGSVIGAWVAFAVKMTSMPEMVALFNGFGGLASMLVGWLEYHVHPESPTSTIISIYFAIVIGGVTFTGSLIAYAKLSERITGRPILFAGQRIINGLLLGVVVVLGAYFAIAPHVGIAPQGIDGYEVLLVILTVSLLLGVMAVIPIGGADMPVVISLLNSYSGLAGAAAGFLIPDKIL